jgi:hypothetical protein
MEEATESDAALLQSIAAGMDKVLNGDAKGVAKRVGFTVLVYNFGDTVNVNYVSNSDRADMVATLKCLLARWEGQPIQSGRA